MSHIKAHPVFSSLLLLLNLHLIWLMNIVSTQSCGSWMFTRLMTDDLHVDNVRVCRTDKDFYGFYLR